MGGGVLQLSLYGSQDVVLSGNPEITFFRLIYKRPSMFSQEAIQQSFQGTADFGRRCVLPITKSGDLVYSTWLQVTLPDLANYAVDAVMTPSDTTPGILSARWTSSTTALVKLIPPTDALTVGYVLTITNTSTMDTTGVESDATEVPITGLTAGGSYTVKAKRKKADNSVGPDCTTVPIISLRWCNNVGHALIRSVELEIGGSRIIRHVSEYMDILAELSMPEEKREGFNSMVAKYDTFDLYDNSFSGERTLFIPLQFPFCKTPGLSLPVVALQFHNINLNFDFRDYTELIKSDAQISSSLINTRGSTPTASIDAYVNFIFLSTEERRRFSTSPMEYLIQETQFLGDVPVIASPSEPNLTRKINLNFSHPVTEIIWVYNSAKTYNSGLAPDQYALQGNDYFNTDLPSPNTGKDPISSAVIHLNGNPRFSERPGAYFRLCQPYAHHTRIPSKNIYSYAFALSPEDPFPTGSCNYSKLDTSHLILRLDPSVAAGASNGRIRVFANSFNLLRIASGMAGLAFASG